MQVGWLIARLSRTVPSGLVIVPFPPCLRRNLLRCGRTVDRSCSFFLWHLLQCGFVAATSGERYTPAWSDLGNPRFFKQVALADPTKSGSAAKAFEMIIQQQMQDASITGGACRRASSLELGWTRGLQVIQRASANTRYFTDSASQVPVDVSLGDAAIGMCIDSAGDFKARLSALATSHPVCNISLPQGRLFRRRGPDRIISRCSKRQGGQNVHRICALLGRAKALGFQSGSSRRARHHALRRQPVRKDLYDAEFAEYRSDPGVDPYRMLNRSSIIPAGQGRSSRFSASQDSNHVSG